MAIFFHPTYDGGVQLKASEGAARSLGVRLQAVTVETAEDLTTAFSELRRNRPGDLPVQRPTKFELVINRRAAKALGLTLPPPLLLRADRLVE